MGDSHLKRQLIRYRDLLTNFSRRNRELYYRASKGSSVNMTCSPFPRTAFKEDMKSAFKALRYADPEFEAIVKGQELDLYDFFQIDDLKDKELGQKFINKLEKIRLGDDRHQREFGISGAWLLGPFLCWRTSPHAQKPDMLITPILKVAIDLKKNRRQRLVLVAEDEELRFNPSLRLCLKQKVGLDIPESQTFDTPMAALEFLRESLEKLGKKLTFPSYQRDNLPAMPPKQKVVRDENGEVIERKPIVLEEVLSSEDLKVYNSVSFSEFMLVNVIYLDQLNASRMVLISDYDAIIEDPTDHPILTELFNGAPIVDEPAVDKSELRKLDLYKERDNHFVVDIDSTQHRAIDKAINSKAIVIQGPPGTGKSQTITNLIAEYIARGKSVLFVSEKRPALDVVGVDPEKPDRSACLIC